MWIPKGAAVIRGRRLFDARHLLEETQYMRSVHALCQVVVQ